MTAHGGAALATLRGFRERTKQERAGMQGSTVISVETTTLLPDRWRQETANQYGQFLVVLTPDAAFRGSLRAAPRPLPEALRRYYAGVLGAHPLALLRAHRTGPLRAVSQPSVDISGAPHDRVAVEHEGVTIVLTLDRSGRIVSQTTRAHAPREGVMATVVRTLSDFRTVGAFTLPFRVDATVDGEPSPDLSYAIESLEIDPAIDAVTIARPPETRP